MPKKLVYTLKEVQELLGFGPRAVSTLIKGGTLPAVRLGRRFVVRKQDLDAILAGKQFTNKSANQRKR